MVSLTARHWVHLIYINGFRLCLNSAEPVRVADDTMYPNRNIKTIETVVNYELKLVTQDETEQTFTEY